LSENYNENQFSPWLLRFEIDKLSLENINISIPEIKQKILNFFEQLFIRHNETYDEQPIIRIRFKPETTTNPDSNDEYREYFEALVYLTKDFILFCLLKELKAFKEQDWIHKLI
jgi:hypothetical protein